MYKHALINAGEFSAGEFCSGEYSAAEYTTGEFDKGNFIRGRVFLVPTKYFATKTISPKFSSTPNSLIQYQNLMSIKK